MVQLLVMVMLAVPGYCYDLAQNSWNDDTCISVHALDKQQEDSHDQCPCCPDDQSEGDGCPACSNCTFYTPLPSAPTASYLPSLAPLEVLEHFTRLADVHIPIFVPPQNLA